EAREKVFLCIHCSPLLISRTLTSTTSCYRVSDGVEVSRLTTEKQGRALKCVTAGSKEEHSAPRPEDAGKRSRRNIQNYQIHTLFKKTKTLLPASGQKHER
ncbi:MAG TPA: hypothetical protein DCX06_14240, partial [Opitutae bacterium]|nr:hypothetical protein [Opitutae bacterium]